MKTSKMATLPNIHNKGFNEKESVKIPETKGEKIKKKNWTWRESGYLFFVLRVAFLFYLFYLIFLQKWSLIITSEIFLFLFFI